MVMARSLAWRRERREAGAAGGGIEGDEADEALGSLRLVVRSGQIVRTQQRIVKKAGKLYKGAPQRGHQRGGATALKSPLLASSYNSPPPPSGGEG